jgi:hypothetical protein
MDDRTQNHLIEAFFQPELVKSAFSLDEIGKVLYDGAKWLWEKGEEGIKALQNQFSGWVTKGFPSLFSSLAGDPSNIEGAINRYFGWLGDVFGINLGSAIASVVKTLSGKAGDDGVSESEMDSAVESATGIAKEASVNWDQVRRAIIIQKTASISDDAKKGLLKHIGSKLLWFLVRKVAVVALLAAGVYVICGGDLSDTVKKYYRKAKAAVGLDTPTPGIIVPAQKAIKVKSGYSDRVQPGKEPLSFDWNPKDPKGFLIHVMNTVYEDMDGEDSLIAGTRMFKDWVNVLERANEDNKSNKILVPPVYRSMKQIADTMIDGIVVAMSEENKKKH